MCIFIDTFLVPAKVTKLYNVVHKYGFFYNGLNLSCSFRSFLQYNVSIMPGGVIKKYNGKIWLLTVSLLDDFLEYPYLLDSLFCFNKFLFYGYKVGVNILTFGFFKQWVLLLKIFLAGVNSYRSVVVGSRVLAKSLDFVIGRSVLLLLKFANNIVRRLVSLLKLCFIRKCLQ